MSTDRPRCAIHGEEMIEQSWWVKVGRKGRIELTLPVCPRCPPRESELPPQVAFLAKLEDLASKLVSDGPMECPKCHRLTEQWYWREWPEPLCDKLYRAGRCESVPEWIARVQFRRRLFE